MGLFLRNENLIIRFSFFLIFSVGIYLCFIGGYGSDEDTLPMIYAFETTLYDGRFVSSRFTGNPVAEIGIGFLSVYFGSFVANLFTYLFLILGLVLFYFSFNTLKISKEIYLFLFLCLTNPILFFDNLEPVDYSWALFFFSLGTFFFNKKIFELAILFFAISIGVRINYVLFVAIIIFFYEFEDKISINRRLNIFLSTFIFGGMFYAPIWFEYKFDLSWLTAGRPMDQGIFGLISRFIFKTYISLGYLSSFLILFFLIKNLKNILIINNFKVLLLLVISNLIIFLWIPGEFSYLQLFLIVILYFIFNSKNKKIIYGVCFLNFISWFIFINPLTIKYKQPELCAPKNAISAKIDIKFENGFLMKYFDSRENIKCWVQGNTARDKKILKGQPLKRD